MRLSHCFLLVTLLPFCSAKDTLPTFLIDYDQVMDHLLVEQNPFTRTHVTRFTNIIENAVTLSTVIMIFVEDKLCTEDLSIKDEKGTAFPYLREQLMTYKVKYYANVVSPVKILTRLLEPTDLNVYTIKPGEGFTPKANMRYFYVIFKDERNETRASTLRRHDKIMQDAYESIRKVTNGAIVAFYTAKMNPVMFSKYDFGPTDVFIGKDPSDVTMASHGALIRFKGLSVEHGRGPSRRATADVERTLKIVGDQWTDRTSMTRVSVGIFHMEFVFNYEKEFWILDAIKLYRSAGRLMGLVGIKEHLGIRVPIGRSYLCDEPLAFYNKYDNDSIVIPAYQIQPFRKMDVPVRPKPPRARYGPSGDYVGQFFEGFRNLFTRGGYEEEQDDGPATEDDIHIRRDHNIVKRRSRNKKNWIDEKLLEFGKPVRCTHYFTIEILSGLIVFSIFLFVLIIAIYCILNIQSNDRFDDPHGKQFHTTTFE